MTRIGTVEVLRTRIYALDAAMSHEPMATTVIVEPGIYPLHRDGLSTYWIMTGQINERGFHRLGDGIFTMQPDDNPTGVEVTFPSRTFGPDEWSDFTGNDVTTQDGHPEQRLRISVDQFAS